MFHSIKSEPEESQIMQMLSDNESDQSDSRPTHNLKHFRSTPHKETNAKVRQYFTTIDYNSFFCNVCERQFKGTVANMKAHLSSIHRELYDEIFNITLSPKTETPSSSGLRTRSRYELDDQSSQEQPTKKARTESHRALIEFVINGGNLKDLEKITGQTLTRDEIQKGFREMAKKVRERIKEELKGKLPHFTVLNSNGLYTVVAHFVDDMELKVRHIGCGYSNCLILQRVFENFETSGNSSVVKVTNAHVDDRSWTLIKAQQNLKAISTICFDECQIIDDVGRLEAMQEEGRENIKNEGKAMNFCGSRLLRNVAKNVTKKFSEHCEIIKKLGGKKVDENRWDFMLVMMKSLTSNTREFEKVEKSTRDFISEYIEAFNILKQTIQQVDDEKILFGDFFLAWTLCEIKLSLRKEETFGVAKAIVEEMKKDENGMNVDEVKSGNFHVNFFLDPRFKYSVDDKVYDMKAQHEAIEFCLATNESILKLQGNQNPKIESSQSSSAIDDDLPLEYKLLQERTGGGSTLPPSNFKDDGLRQKLMKFGLEPKRFVKPGEKFDVLNYWKQLKDHPDYKDIVPIAAVVLANPASRFEIVKEFSALSLAFAQVEQEVRIDCLNDFLLVSKNLDLIDD